MRCSTNIIRWRRASFSSCPPTSVTKTRKKFARRHSSPSCETWHHFRERVLFKPGCCASPRTRRWIFAEKVAPRNAAATFVHFSLDGARRKRPNRSAIGMSRAGCLAGKCRDFSSHSAKPRSAGGSCREIIELRYYGELSYGEIAAELRLNPKTVSSRLSKCLDRLCVIAKKIFPSEHSFAV